MDVQNPFAGFEDLTGTFSVTDVVLAMALSFVLCSLIGLVYRTTHRGISYSQTYVQTLVMMGMIIPVVMLVVGSNIARAFALVGALSIIRFRNAIKETRDVGFIFFAMAIGMAIGARFYLLAIIATLALSAAMNLMERLTWFKLDVRGQILKVQAPAGNGYSDLLNDVLLTYTTHPERSARAQAGRRCRRTDRTRCLFVRRHERQRGRAEGAPRSARRCLRRTEFLRAWRPLQVAEHSTISATTQPSTRRRSIRKPGRIIRI